MSCRHFNYIFKTNHMKYWERKNDSNQQNMPATTTIKRNNKKNICNTCSLIFCATFLLLLLSFITSSLASLLTPFSLSRSSYSFSLHLVLHLFLSPISSPLLLFRSSPNVAHHAALHVPILIAMPH